MSSEVELGTIGVLGGLFRRTKGHAFEPGSHCENCQTQMMGHWCYTCGQEAAHLHKSIAHLLLEAFEGMFHADGRLWRTLPRLALNPGQLTRDFVDGKRAPQAPPFSIFLVVVVLFVSVGVLTEAPIKPVRQGAPVSAQQAANIAAETPKPGDGALALWIKSRAMIALEQPDRFRLVAEEWEHRLAILMLPVSALLLSLVFVFQRRFYVYDHLVFSMHSLAFTGLVLTAWTLARLVVGDWANWLFLLLPIHLFVHMRGFYRVSVVGALGRMTILGIGSLVLYSLLLFALVLISLSAMTA